MEERYEGGGRRRPKTDPGLPVTGAWSPGCDRQFRRLIRTLFRNEGMQILRLIAGLLLLPSPLVAQGPRLWVLRAPGEMVEYDAKSFVTRQTVRVPAEALKPPASLQANRLGQMLFAPAVSLPLSEDDAKEPHKVWIWDGHAPATIDQGLKRKVEDRGSNKEIAELAPAVFLASDGIHLFWFGNDARRLEREEVDLSTATTWQVWQTDLAGGAREDLASSKLPDCRCPTGSCEESCASGVVWVPDGGVERFFLLTQYVAAQTTPVYKASALYHEDAGKWTPTALAQPLHRVLDAASGGNTIVEAIPDTGCCGWSNQSNDQTLVLTNGKKITVFDEQATYKNQDYDVSFLTSNAYLSPDASRIAMTVTATAQPNKPIQLAEQGQANPEESQKVRKALTELPALVVKSVEDTPKQIAFVPHATLVGWISDKEILIVEDHLLIVYNVASGGRKKSSVRGEDAAHVFLR